MLIPFDGYYTIDVCNTVKVANNLKRKAIIPIHYEVPRLNTVFDPLSTYKDFVNKIPEWNLKENISEIKINKWNLYNKLLNLRIVKMFCFEFLVLTKLLQTIYTSININLLVHTFLEYMIF